MKTSDLPISAKGGRQRARNLRNNMTKAEWKLWGYIRNKQLDIRFRRQHPIGNYIVDFIALKIGLIIEIDGAQHYESRKEENDKIRTRYLERLGLKVIRFNNYEVLTNIDGVLAKIIMIIEEMDK
jgi:very-short-patch-repair endonuclease